MATKAELRDIRESIGFSMENIRNENVQRQEVMQIFEKKFQYQRNKNEEKWTLPPVTELFQEYYQFDTLQNLRERLNCVKSKLNDYVIEEWSEHTRRKDPSGEIPWRLKNDTNAEFVTVAWCKFFECLHRYPLVTNTKLNSLHLCEAPGAFIAALNHYLNSTYEPEEIEWKWLSTTLNPYYEGNPLNKMIADDRFMLHTLDNWLFHGDFTGNIMRRKNIEHMQKECEKRLDGKVHLITADGSIDCVETPDCQEEMVAKLHFAEITAALSILAQGGAFVIKLFTFFDAESVSKLFLLHCVFEEVHVFKPATSKRGNSEVYVICLNYHKDTKHLPDIIDAMKSRIDCQHNSCLLPMFTKAQLPVNFVQQHEICVRFFMNMQIRAIEMNISSFESKLRHITRRNHQLRTLVCKEYYRRYRVQPLPSEKTILYSRKCVIEFGTKKFLHRGSYSERELLKDIAVAEQIFKLRSTLNDLEKSMQISYDILLDTESPLVGNQNVKIYKGEPYKTLYNSLFTAVQLLQLRQKLMEIFLFEPLYYIQPMCIVDNEEIPIFIDEQEGSPNFFEIHRRFLLDVLSKISTKHAAEVRFINYAFLSHFSVSILRFLADNNFQRILITTEPTFTVHLFKSVYSDHSHQTLNEFRSLIEKDNKILCIANITQLHRNDFANAITEFNNLLLLRNLKSMLCT